MRLVLRFVLSMVPLASITFPNAFAAEFRGLYVDAFHPGFMNHQEVTQMVNSAKTANFNALIVQVRKRGDAYYNSTVEPRAADIAPDYDPLADIITQAHAQGLEVHAWLSVYEVGNEIYTNLPANHIVRAHPEWLMADREGRTTLPYGKMYADPGVPAVRAHVVSLVTDILTRYQVDGIHLDQVRYPGRTKGYNPASVACFNEQHSRTGLPADDDPTWCQWRRDQVSQLVRDVRSALNSARPTAKLSAGCILEPDTASAYYMQDWGSWLRDGLVDFAVSMLYITQDSLAQYASSAVSASCSRHVYIGIGAFRVPKELALKFIADARTAGAPGVVLYNYHYLGPNSTLANCARMSDLVTSAFAQPADLPQMPWKQ